MYPTIILRASLMEIELGSKVKFVMPCRKNESPTIIVILNYQTEEFKKSVDTSSSLQIESSSIFSSKILFSKEIVKCHKSAKWISK